jgi:hypothetical protein
MVFKARITKRRRLAQTTRMLFVFLQWTIIHLSWKPRTYGATLRHKKRQLRKNGQQLSRKETTLSLRPTSYALVSNFKRINVASQIIPKLFPQKCFTSSNQQHEKTYTGPHERIRKRGRDRYCWVLWKASFSNCDYFLLG